ncbi:unconventional myosin-VIIa [Platysternon megacephalum]|uniref:Unconventional myosin-VIIa n=1 Tax=Platysternon megacephalum TaxID=55544 RepID=A0A4D9F9W6_9SAUR|nr:unconventional myosin-VIIa [Platysternon megacephalum]
MVVMDSSQKSVFVKWFIISKNNVALRQLIFYYSKHIQNATITMQSELNHFFGNVRTSSHTEITTCKSQKKKSKKEEQKATDEQN